MHFRGEARVCILHGSVGGFDQPVDSIKCKTVWMAKCVGFDCYLMKGDHPSDQPRGCFSASNERVGAGTTVRSGRRERK